MAQDHEEMVKDIHRAVFEDDLELSEWEDRFLDSIATQLRHGGELSARQDEKLEQIWKKATGR
jgi:hypothetical protein